MKILFLDMDGVLNSEESFVANHHAREEERFKRNDASVAFAKEFCWPLGHISPPLVERLNKIVENTHCKIVLSSSWRIICSIEELRGWLTQKGFVYADRLIDKTGQNSKDARGGEIQDWLDAHPEVTKYVILDDDSEDIIGSYTTKKHPNNFVHVPFKWGLQDEHIIQVIEILNEPRI